MEQELKSRFFAAKRACFDKLYSKLNSMQRQAVFTVEGPLLVLAGAGSGKTTVLVHRIAHIIRYGNAYRSENLPEALCEDEVRYLEMMARGEVACDGVSLTRYADGAVPPWAILSITFTNKAADSMKQKLRKILPEGAADEIWAGTFHSVCAKLLRREIDAIGFDKSFAIYDTDDTKKLITECIKELEMSSDKMVPKQVQNIISRAKDKLCNAEEFSKTAGNDVYLDAVAKIFRLYEEKLRNANALDFDDLIGKTVELFTKCPEVLEHYQNRFRYIMVDEYQDTNTAQFKLVAMLSEKYHNIMVVGDDDQSIYSFRGATVENILTFDKAFAKAKIVKLEQNYRSTKSILGAANSLIAKNNGRYGKTLWSELPEGELPTVVEVDSSSDEVKFIADTVLDEVAKGKKFSDFAILYRLNSQSAGFETVFAKSAIPYRMLCGIRFYERAEVKDIVAYMQLCANVKDDVRLLRIVNTPRRGIGDATLDAVAKLAAYKGCSMFEIMEDSQSYEALSRSAQKLTDFCAFIRKMQEYADSLPIHQFIERLSEESGYVSMLLAKGEEGAEKLDNVRTLADNAKAHEEGAESADLISFLEEVALISDVDNYDTDANAVTMMTVHSAKGLEFPTVFLPGLEEGIFPGDRVVSASEEEEERRLAYVAVTRAMKELYIVHARERFLYGRTNFNRPSRFIKEIDPDFKNEISLARTRTVRSEGFGRVGFGGGYGGYTDKVQFSPARSAAPKTPVKMPEKRPEPKEKFKAGDAVLHKTFGEGLVLSVTDMGGDTLYEVAFPQGTKKLMASFAKLQKKN